MTSAAEVSIESPIHGQRFLVADDQPDVLEALRLLLKASGCVVTTVDSPVALLRAVAENPFDLILMDMNYSRDTTSGEEGLALLDKLRASGISVPVIVMTGWGDVDLAVEAMRRGAANFVRKPWDNARLVRTIENQATEAARQRKAKRLAKSDVEIARQVQQNLFPHHAKGTPTVSYAGQCVPASAVGGDYYDFLELGGGQVGFVLADVSGKGVPAALLMSNLQAMFRSHCELGATNAPSLLTTINRLFYEVTGAERYASLFFGCYDDQSRRLRYINCGHPPPLLFRTGSAVRHLQPTCTVIGMFKEWCAVEAEVELAPGEILVIVSDGVTEAGIESDNEFGEARLLSVVEANRLEPPAVLVEAMMRAVIDFTAPNQADDITIVAVKVGQALPTG